MNYETMTKSELIEKINELEHVCSTTTQLVTSTDEKFLDKIINTIADPIFVKDDQSRMVLVNEAFCATFGLPRSSIIGKTLAEDVPPDQREQFLKVDQQVLKDGKENECQEFLTVRGGVTRTIVTKKTRYIDDQGNKFIVGVIRDITEFKTVEENYKRLFERFNLATRATQMGVFDWDIINDVLIWDDRMYELYGIKKTELPMTYESWAQSIHPDDLVNASRIAQEAVRGERDYNNIFRVKMPDESIKYIKANADVIRDSNGKAVRMVGINWDSTNQQKNEAQIIRSEKLESIGILAGGIAHDFNNLIAGMFGFIELALSQCDQKKFDKVSASLTKSLTMFHRAKDLSNQLLTFSKGGRPLVKPQSIVPVITRSSEFTLSGSNIELALNLQDDLWDVEIDENQIGQAIDNLVINSKQAMPSGGKITITARNIGQGKAATQGLKTGNYVSILIEDSGAGISPEILSHIFDPFFTTKAQGSGIGLATVHSIIKKHGGMIDVQSQLGKGARFTIYLPASSQQEINTQEMTSQNFKFEGHALIMDDQESLLQIFASNLESIGCTVVCAKNGDEAIKIFDEAYKTKNPFNLALLDLTIPGGKGGKDVVEHIRKIDKSLIAIASSGYSDDPIIAEPKNYGFNGSIAKPFNKSDLIEILGRAISH